MACLQSPANCRHALTLMVIAGLLSGTLSGCHRGGQDADAGVVDLADSVPWSGPPEAFLKSIFSRYHHASTYHDQAQVRLSYMMEGRRQSEHAPLSVSLDRDRLAVAAYDVRIDHRDQLMLAWITDPGTKQFDSQVLKVTTPGGRPSLESMLIDELLIARLQAGLAGPPPQLEWLFAEEPMPRLFDEPYQFQWSGHESVEGQRCVVVRVTVDNDRYGFWIDEQEGVIRRVEMPLTGMAHPAASAAGAVSMTLSLELHQASFSVAPSPPPASVPPRPRWVRRLVPLPPPEPSRLLGSRPVGYRLVESRQPRMREAGQSSDKIRVLTRFAGDERSVAAALSLQDWYQRLPAALAAQIEVWVLVDILAAEQIPPTIQLPWMIDHHQAAKAHFALVAGGLTILDAHGRITWLQPQVGQAELVSAGIIVSDMAAGIDVPQRLREQWQADIDAYQEALQQAATSAPDGSK